MAVDPFWSDVILRMTMDEVLTDFSDVGNVMGNVTGASPGTPAVTPPDWVPGQFAQAYSPPNINNTSRRLEVQGSTAPFDLGSGDFTVEYWLFIVASTARWVVSSDNISTGTRAFNFGISTRVTSGSETGKYSIEASLFSAANASMVNISGGLEFGPTGNGVGEWTHLCFERAGGNFRVYRNGVMIHKVTTLGATAVHAATAPVRMGGRPTFAGDVTMTGAVHRIDDVRFTKGVARYDSDAGFSVPTEAFPTSSGSGSIEVDPGAGSLVLTGNVPVVSTSGADVEVFAGEGQLIFTGEVPSFFQGLVVSPAAGQLVISPGAAEVLIFTTAAAILSQSASLAVVVPPVPPAHVAQLAVMAVATTVPDLKVSQQAILVVAHGVPCVTERCQVWTITRRDGVVFRYTSHDEDVRFAGQAYKACHSLNPSASENASSLGSVGNMELTGLIDDEGITEADLYGGKFDDAYVTVDLINWNPGPSTPRRLASGWTGQLSQGDTSFNMEVLGSSARLEQQALTQPYAPGCRWVFGDARCGVNIEARKLTGVVTSAATRSAFVGTITGDPAGSEWTNGRVRFTSGVNIGQDLEVKTVDFGTGQVLLWPSAVLLPHVGDAFDLLPGCDKSKVGGCTLYANVINFGGFADVPGQDAMLETPDAQY